MKAFIVPDLHHPYHDPNMVDLACDILEDLKPDYIIFIGDVFDCEQISKYHHNAYKLRVIQEEVEFCHRDIFGYILGAAPNAKRVFICGNHENRINTFAENFLTPFGGKDFVSIQQLLQLDKFDEFIPYMESFKIGNTYFTHGHYVRQDPGSSVKRHMDFYPGNVVIGHTHRIGTHSQITYGGGVRVGTEIGHGAIAKNCPGWKPTLNWHQSAGAVYYQDRDGLESVEVYRSLDGKTVACGDRRYRIV